MNSIANYYLYNFNSIIISKLGLFSLKNFPKIKNLTLFFIINIKQYKKNLLLFYIIINLIFGGILVLKINITNYLQLINLVLKKKKKIFFYKLLLIFIYHF